MAPRKFISIIAILSLLLVGTAFAITVGAADDPVPDQGMVARDRVEFAQQEQATPEVESPLTPYEMSATPEGRFGFGNRASRRTIRQLNIDVPPSGEGLPEGGGTAQEGEEVYNTDCARCHGPEGEGGGIGPQLIAQGEVWEVGEPRTVDNYWPYATTIYDYVNRAMPFDNPHSLEPDEVYAVTAYLLYLGGIIDEDEEMNAETLPEVEMPNRDAFEPCWPEQCLQEEFTTGMGADMQEAEEDATPEARSRQRVEVELTEFEILMPQRLDPGRTTFVVTNTGSIAHNFEIEGQEIERVFDENLQPGETRRMTVDLEEGRYTIYCPVGNHRERGMEIEVRAR